MLMFAKGKGSDHRKNDGRKIHQSGSNRKNRRGRGGGEREDDGPPE